MSVSSSSCQMSSGTFSMHCVSTIWRGLVKCSIKPDSEFRIVLVILKTRRLQIFINRCDTKLHPWSVWIASEAPNWHIHSPAKFLATVWPSWFGSLTGSTQWVKYYWWRVCSSFLAWFCVAIHSLVKCHTHPWEDWLCWGRGMHNGLGQETWFEYTLDSRCTSLLHHLLKFASWTGFRLCLLFATVQVDPHHLLLVGHE